MKHKYIMLSMMVCHVLDILGHNIMIKIRNNVVYDTRYIYI